MKSSSLKPLLKANIPNPHEYRDKLIHDWYSVCEECHYSLKVCPSQDFLNLIDTCKNGEIPFGQHTYSLVWINSREMIEQNKQVIISFRWSFILNCGYALVKIFNEKKKEEINEPKN